MTGGQMAHPLLLSLTNINMSFHMKASNCGFLLLALLPVSNFIHPDSKIRGMLENCLIHECLDFILQPVKVAAQIGIMMSDPLCNQRHVFTGLAAYIVDMPESAALAGEAGMTSSVTMATYKEFGDPFRHEPRNTSTTITQLRALEAAVDTWDLEKYAKVALESYRLNGIHQPFWRDWPMAEPSEFLTPKPLHHWHKMFWDHDAKWCIHAVGASKIDFRFSILHPHTVYRHFISKLKQVTGREHQDVQRYIVGIIAGAVPKCFLIAVRALIDFRYLGQAPEISDTVLLKIKSALKEFHDHKDAIQVELETGRRRVQSKTGIFPSSNFYKVLYLISARTELPFNGQLMLQNVPTSQRSRFLQTLSITKIMKNRSVTTSIVPRSATYLILQLLFVRLA
jgi:hypothetical protein